jgi:hypothetical protein
MMPVLLLVIGILEFTVAYRDNVAVASAARTGVRVASTGADDGPCVPDAADETPCPSGAVPLLAQTAANAIARAGTAVPEEAIRHIMVYKANDNGFPGSLSSTPSSCAGVSNCVMYVWRPLVGEFRYASGSWPSASINACFPSNVDSVGVNVVADHAFITGLFGATVTLSERAVMQFEPLPPESCASGAHL